MTVKTEKTFPEIVADAMDKIKTLPGWRKEFISRFKKSESTVANWKSGKTIASEEDKIHFLEVVNSIARDLGVSTDKLNARKSKVMEEYSQLFD